jgi:hypothetical protein
MLELPNLFSALFAMWTTPFLPAADEAISDEVQVCDDGSSPYDENGRPNVDCEIEGCTVIEPVCWSYRIDRCYDESGSENGVCTLSQADCHNALTCHGLYLACVGEWACEDPHWWGCGEGSCTEAEPSGD